MFNYYPCKTLRRTTGLACGFLLELKECVDYVTTHFSSEEKLMKFVGYEQFSDHKIRHEEFTKKVLETSTVFGSMSFSDAIKFCKYLYDWVLSHIAHEDKLYVKKVMEYKQTQSQ